MMIECRGKPVLYMKYTKYLTPEKLIARIEKDWKITPVIAKTEWQTPEGQKLDFYMSEKEMRRFLLSCGYVRTILDKSRDTMGLWYIVKEIGKPKTLFSENNPFTIYNKVMAFWGRNYAG